MALIEVDIPEFKQLGKTILSGIRLSIEQGERVAIVGGNRSGKTALALWLAGWLPDHLTSLPGSVTFEGRPWASLPLAERAAAVQFVGQMPQQQLSGREFTVRDEIAFGPGNLCLPEQEIASRVDQVIAQCGLESLAGRYPYTLSGGEQQMVVFAGTLAMHPRLLVLDEPMSGFDPDAAARVLQILHQLPSSTTIVMADISSRFVIHLASRFLLLDAGRCIGDGSAEEILLRPEAVRVLGSPVTADALQTVGESKSWLAESVSSGTAQDTVVLKAEEVGFAFQGGEVVLAEVSFAVTPGRLSILTGRNGAGKSTLLHLCNGLLKATAGRIIVNGQATRNTSAATLARVVGTVFQSPEQQIFHSQVLAEIAFGPKQLGFSAREAERCARESLARVGMEAFAAVHPLDLDRTSRRWITLASALASKPKLLLIDEVQQGMDAVAVQRLETLLAEERRAGTATLFICHDAGFTARNADDILVLEGGRLFAECSTRK